MTQSTGTQPATGPWVPDASTFGARLALIRQRMKWGNVAQAAKECGVPTESWRNWEEGREPRRLVTIALAIATRTNVDLDWLVYGPARASARVTEEYPRRLDPLAARVIPRGTVRHGDGRRDRRVTPVRSADIASTTVRRPPTSTTRSRPLSHTAMV